MVRREFSKKDFLTIIKIYVLGVFQKVLDFHRKYIITFIMMRNYNWVFVNVGKDVNIKIIY